jgi:hypothetical protein
MGNMGIFLIKIWEEYGRFWRFPGIFGGKYGKYGRPKMANTRLLRNIHAFLGVR